MQQESQFIRQFKNRIQILNIHVAQKLNRRNRMSMRYILKFCKEFSKCDENDCTTSILE